MQIRFSALFLMGGLALAPAGSSRAALVSFAGVDIPIATTPAGTSINLETGASANTDDFFGADVNFFFGGLGIGNDADTSVGTPTLQTIRLGVGSIDTIDNRGLGTPVGGSNTYSTGFGGSGDHIGSTFTDGVPGYIGFSLESGSGLVYGWMLVTLTNNASGGTVHSWAYDDTPGTSILVGAVPEPGVGVLGLLGVGALALRRRR